jgi:hypothetical protein
MFGRCCREMVMPVDEAWPLRIAREHMPAKRIPDQHSLRIGRSPSLLGLEFDTFDDLDINSPAFSAFALKKNTSKPVKPSLSSSFATR